MAFFIIGCVNEKHTPDILSWSFRDIPGITDEEIAAIETLKNTRESFSYGSLLSEEASKLSGGRHPGFSVLFCDMLSELFGIPFNIEKHDWQELKNRIDSCEIDFTGTINATTDVENQYFKTSPVIGSRLSVFVKEEGLEVFSEYDLRDKKIGFFSGSYSERIFRKNFPRINFHSVQINTVKEMADKLYSGEIEAFIYDAPDVFTFYEYPFITKINSFPYIYVPVSVSTANPDFLPVISVITKYLMAGGIEEVSRLNAIGEHDYASYVLNYALNEEERAYINNLKINGEKIPVGFTFNRYPVAFYNEDADEYQGIAKDVLNEISSLTGIEFEIAHDKTTAWVQLESMLKTGEIKLLSQLIPNEARREYAIWPDTHYFTARYALLSNLNYPYLSLNQVPYVRVGLPRGTAEEAIYKLWFPDAEYIEFRTTDEGLTALEKREIDLYFCLDYTLLYESNFRENAGQKVNILFNDLIEVVPFGLNINEVILCSIVSKAQRIVNTDRIVRSWTSRVFDLSSQMAKERVRYLSITVICLISLLVVMIISLLIYFKLRRASFESKKNLQILLDMLPVGVRILSLDDWTLLYSNKACLDIFGCQSFEEQVEGQTGLKFMPEIQPDGRSTMEHMEELFRTDKAIAEIQCLKLSGEPFICRMTSRTINYSDNKGRNHRSSLGAMEDVTQERRHRETLQNAVLREHEANQLKSRFLAMMSHEIRTPMNAILGITEIQLQNDTLPSETEEALGRIYDSGNLLLNIINDILDLSKIEAGKMEIIPVKYNIPSLINDVVQLNRLKYEDKPVEFILDINENTPLNLFGDELRLRQVLNNIISNAFKYTDKGTVSFTVTFEPVSNGKENSVMMVFIVKDTGQGMTEEHLEKLFDEYTRFNLDSNRTTVGTGLGMSITKKILELMDGKIAVESKLGMGSVFTVRLPQKRIDSLVCGRDTIEKLKDFRFNSAIISKKSRLLREYMPYGSVLIVDDVETNIYVTKGMLLPYGLKVDSASSGFEAIEKVKEGNEYDIIFMDHMMPRMDGIKAAKIIRDLGYKNDIIALTANALVGQAEVFLENGFNGYITKPIDSRELNHVLNEFIRNKKPPEIVKEARREQRKKTREPEITIEKKIDKMEVEKFFVIDAESAVSILEGMFRNPVNLEDVVLDSDELSSYEITVHGMKSALSNIGEDELSDAALKLETAAMKKDFAVITVDTPLFINDLRRLINKYSPPDNNGKQLKTKISEEEKSFLCGKLKEVIAACNKLDIKEAREILEELRKKTWPRYIDDYIDEINVHLLHSAFKKAALACETAAEDIIK